MMAHERERERGKRPPGAMRLHDAEAMLFALGCVYERSQSSHHFYRAPNGARVHICGKSISSVVMRQVMAAITGAPGTVTARRTLAQTG